jgi:hypothetical protein
VAHRPAPHNEVARSRFARHQPAITEPAKVSARCPAFIADALEQTRFIEGAVDQPRAVVATQPGLPRSLPMPRQHPSNRREPQSALSARRAPDASVRQLLCQMASYS